MRAPDPNNPTDGTFGAGQPLPDDRSEDPGNALVDLLAPSLLPAYIEVQVVSFPTPDSRDDGEFVHNVATINHTHAENKAIIVQDVAMFNEVPFWVVQLYGAYEGRADSDYDDELGFTLGREFPKTQILATYSMKRFATSRQTLRTSRTRIAWRNEQRFTRQATFWDSTTGQSCRP